MRYQKRHIAHFLILIVLPQQGRAERGGCLGVSCSNHQLLLLLDRSLAVQLHYKHMIIPEDVFFLLPWAFVNVQISPLLSLPFSLASCHLWIQTLKPMSVS